MTGQAPGVGETALTPPGRIPQFRKQVVRAVGKAGSKTARWLLVTLLVALAPVGLLSFIAALQSALDNERQRIATMTLVAQRQAAMTDLRLREDRAAIARALVTAEAAGGTLPQIARLGVAADHRCVIVQRTRPPREGARLRLVDGASGRDLCTGEAGEQPVTADTLRIDAARQEAAIATPLGGGALLDTVYSGTALEMMAPAINAGARYRLELRAGEDLLSLRNLLGGPRRFTERGRAVQIPGTGGATIVASSPTVLLRLDVLTTLLTPLAMWLLAAGMAWFVADRILLDPIQRLSRRMRDFTPGEVIAAPPPRFMNAPEVLDLGHNFEALTREVADSQTEMAQALSTQKALTKEVHHRVKNNLQIILSLINLHSRQPTRSKPAHEVFRTVQRRVEALAVVHRHLHAESESARGIDLGAMLSELLVGLGGSLAISSKNMLTIDAQTEVGVVQDVALPAAFFVTELVELAHLIDDTAPTHVDLAMRGADEIALHVTSRALAGHGGEFAEDHLIYDRVLTGLARQLRREVVRDEEIGRYSLTVPTVVQSSRSAA